MFRTDPSKKGVAFASSTEPNALIRAFLKGVRLATPLIILLIATGISISAFLQRIQGAAIPTFFGWGIASVQTGSMEPEIPTGSLLLIHKQTDYQVGDVITYLFDPESLTVTHRIVFLEGDTVTTKGDANNKTDQPFTSDKIIGKVVLSVPYFGRLFISLQNSNAMAIIMILAVLLWILPDKKKMCSPPEDEETSHQSHIDH